MLLAHKTAEHFRKEPCKLNTPATLKGGCCSSEADELARSKRRGRASRHDPWLVFQGRGLSATPCSKLD